MLELDKLKQEREQAYDVWFERWWKKANIEQEIEIANSKGYTEVTIPINYLSDYTQDRVADKRFLKKLKKKLPGFGASLAFKPTLFKNIEFLYGIRIWWR
jgi:hypothetical protein